MEALSGGPLGLRGTAHRRGFIIIAKSTRKIVAVRTPDGRGNFNYASLTPAMIGPNRPYEV